MSLMVSTVAKLLGFFFLFLPLEVYFYMDFWVKGPIWKY